MKFTTAALFKAEYAPPSLCEFGITEGILGASLGSLIGGGLGIGETAGGIVAGGLEGAGVGALGSAVTGGNPLMGALTGGFTGAAIPAFGPLLGEATGLGTTAGDILAGTGAGAIGSLVTGGNPLIGGLTGGAGGALAGISGSAAPSTGTTIAPTAAVTGGGAPSAAATAGVSPAGGTPVDLASNLLGTPDFGPSVSQATSAFGLAPATTGGSSTGDWSARAGGGSSGGGVGSNIMGFIEKNPGLLLGAGVLGANMLMGDKPLPAETALNKAALEAQSQSETLAGFQRSGTLPSGLQSVVDQQFNAAKGAIVDQYSRLGLGNSTMLADKLTQLRAEKSSQVAQFADMLAKQGLQWANMSAQEFSSLLQAQTAQENAFTNALGSFAGGLAGLRTGGGSTSTG